MAQASASVGTTQQNEGLDGRRKGRESLDEGHRTSTEEQKLKTVKIMLMASQNPQLHTITVGWIGLY
jgi:hypothetical protein